MCEKHETTGGKKVFNVEYEPAKSYKVKIPIEKKEYGGGILEVPIEKKGHGGGTLVLEITKDSADIDKDSAEIVRLLENGGVVHVEPYEKNTEGGRYTANDEVKEIVSKLEEIADYINSLLETENQVLAGVLNHVIASTQNTFRHELKGVSGLLSVFVTFLENEINEE